MIYLKMKSISLNCLKTTTGIDDVIVAVASSTRYLSALLL